MKKNTKYIYVKLKNLGRHYFMNKFVLKDLHEAIKSQNVPMVGLIALHIPKKDICKDTLFLAIDSKSKWITKIISERSNENNFDKSTMQKAMDSYDPAIIQIITNKTHSKYFDKNLLFSAIKKLDQECIEKIANKTPHRHFDKELLLASINIQKPHVINEIVPRCSQKLFDNEIMEKALQTKKPFIVRAIADHTTDMSVFTKYKYDISKAILGAHDIQSFAGQILSLENNRSFDVEMQETVLDIYMDVILDNMKQGKMPKDFPIGQFEKSVEQSRLFFSRPDALNFDSLNEKNRFLILPIYSYGHAFSAIVKKTNAPDKYSITLVNLGARPFEMSGKGTSYKEYICTKQDAINVLKKHSYNVRLYYPANAVPTPKAYRNFSAKAKEEYTINVQSRDQKLGNCFLKNIEKGLRYALAIGLSKTADPSFSEESLRVTAKSGEKQKVKFLKPIHKPGEKTNELTTLELRKQLIDALIKRFPEYQNEIMQEWTIYKSAKELKNYAHISHHAPVKRMKTKEDSPIFSSKNNAKTQSNDSLVKKMQHFTNKTNAKTISKVISL